MNGEEKEMEWKEEKEEEEFDEKEAQKEMKCREEVGNAIKHIYSIKVLNTYILLAMFPQQWFVVLIQAMVVLT